ncbi:hypothetical protein C0995_012734 [Termitomyces sp. Mi166|nr:hypothetical protein C0995_012734 [Termitomyces sp. Mi166\
MFAALGDEWAMSVFAFLSLVCTPIPILFHKHGSWIRSKSRVASKEPVVEGAPVISLSSNLTTIQEKAQDTEGQK